MTRNNINKLIAAVKNAGRFDDECNVFQINYECEDYVYLSVNGFKYSFYPAPDLEDEISYYIVFPGKSCPESYEDLPGVRLDALFSELERVYDSLDEMVNFSTGKELLSLAKPEQKKSLFDDFLYNTPTVYYFPMVNSGAVPSLHFNVMSGKFYWYVLYMNAGSYNKPGADAFIEHMRQELILKPLDKSRMEDVTDEDRDVLRMMNYG